MKIVRILQNTFRRTTIFLGDKASKLDGMKNLNKKLDVNWLIVNKQLLIRKRSGNQNYYCVQKRSNSF